MPIVQHMTAEGFGAYVGKYSERLKVTRKGDVQQQAPLMHLQSVTLIGDGVSISTDALAACCERGIPVYVMNGLGDVIAGVYSAALNGTVQTRRQQILAGYDERGLQLAFAFSAAKLHNQARTLRYWARNRRQQYPEQAAQLRETAIRIDADAERLAHLPDDMPDDMSAISAWLMGMEGTAARRYWQAVRLIVPDGYAWPGRIGRGAVDPVNSLLNYGYGILYREVERAIILAGLDPYAGFLHADRPGKPSLVLDLIEEFRQIAVDRTVVGLVARDYRVEMDESARLTEATRRDFAARITGQLAGKTRYRGKRHLIRHIIQNQAREIAAHVRGDRPYVAFVFEE